MSEEQKKELPPAPPQPKPRKTFYGGNADAPHVTLFSMLDKDDPGRYKP
jgi:hypothetical protein